MFSRTTQTLSTMLGLALVGACAEERPPRSTSQFLDNPIMLEAAMVRCAQDRSATRYDAECMNARQAVQQIEAKEEAARRIEAEARSERKRQALRRTQEAAAQARRRAADSERLREEAEYLAQFGVAAPDSLADGDVNSETGNLPVAVIREGESELNNLSGPGDTLPATDGGNAPLISAEPEEPASDLDSIRDELQQRSEEGGD